MKIIGNIKPPIFSVIKSHIDDHLIIEEKNMRIGEVYTHGISEEALTKSFRQLLNENDYKTRESSCYVSRSLASCRGSIGHHDDLGYGLVALWLVRINGLSSTRASSLPDRPEFFADNQWKVLKLGDVVVFNANNKHAWLANETCHMLMQTVTKKRKRS